SNLWVTAVGFGHPLAQLYNSVNRLPISKRAPTPKVRRHCAAILRQKALKRPARNPTCHQTRKTTVQGASAWALGIRDQQWKQLHCVVAWSGKKFAANRRTLEFKCETCKHRFRSQFAPQGKGHPCPR